MKQPTARLIGVLTSLALHVLVCVTAYFVVVEGRVVSTGARPAGAGGSGGGSDDSGAPAARARALPTPSDAPLPDVRRILEDQTRYSDGLSDEQKMQAIQNRMPVLDKINPQSVDSAAGLIEKIKGVEGRAAEPRPGATGRIDLSSDMLSDINRKVKDGKVVYEYTSVDKDGRAIVSEVPAEQMTQQDLIGFNLFQMARQNKSFRRLMDAALRLADEQVNSKENSRK